MKKNIKAFTLVELIVAITIIAILGTIAFISMQSYSANARDSTRISDLSAMKTSLELFQLDAGKYPDPTDGFIVSYSGSEVWTQGIFGETTFTNISKLDKIPSDPLTEKEYTYSVTKTRQEYQFAGIVEGDEITLNPFIGQTNAGDVMATALVTGTYNGQMLKTQNGTNCNILSLPSIVSSEPNTTTDLTVILDNRSLVYNGYKNLPTNYISSKYKSDGGFMFTSNKVIVYDDSATCTPLYNPEDNTARIELITNLQEAYSGTLIENEDDITGLVNVDLTNSGELDKIAATIVNNNLGGNLPISNNVSDLGSNSCTWVSKFDNTKWGEVLGEPNRTEWQGENLYFNIFHYSSSSNVLGTWAQGYRPEKMRVTFTKTNSTPVKLQFGAEDGPRDSENNIVKYGYTSGEVIDLTFGEGQFSDIGGLSFEKTNEEDPDVGVTVSNIEYCDMSGEGVPDEEEGGGDTCPGITGELPGDSGLPSFDLCSNLKDLNISSTVDSYINMGGRDVYKMTLEGGKNYKIGTYNNMGGENGVDTSIFLYDSAGNLITYNYDVSDWEYNSEISFNVENSGVYYLGVMGNYDSAEFDYGVALIELEDIWYNNPELNNFYSGNSNGYSLFANVNNNVLYFNALDEPNGNYQLWSTDGTLNNTSIFKNTSQPGEKFISNNFVELNGKTLFVSYDGWQGAGNIWVSDGTSEGTNVLNSGPWSGLGDLHVYNGYAYFYGEKSYVPGLWRTDGTDVGTSLVSSTKVPFTYCDNVEYNEKLYLCTLFDHNRNLTTTDGTDAGTNFLTNNLGDKIPYTTNFVNYNGSLYFISDKKTLYKSNGTSGGTTIIFDTNPEDYAYERMDNLLEFNGKLYLKALFNGTYNLIETDGTTGGTTIPSFYSDNIFEKTLSDYSQLFLYNGEMYFTVNSGDPEQTELRKTDGTTNGTVLIKGGFVYNTHITSFRIFDNKLYFEAFSEDNIDELWVTDGTADGTSLFKTIGNRNTMYGNAYFIFLGKMYFYVNTYNENENEIWVTDGTPEGTKPTPLGGETAS